MAAIAPVDDANLFERYQNEFNMLIGSIKANISHIESSSSLKEGLFRGKLMMLSSLLTTVEKQCEIAINAVEKELNEAKDTVRPKV